MFGQDSFGSSLFSVSIISRTCSSRSHGEPLTAVWGTHRRRETLLWQKMVGWNFTPQKHPYFSPYSCSPLGGSIVTKLVCRRHFMKFVFHYLLINTYFIFAYICSSYWGVKQSPKLRLLHFTVMLRYGEFNSIVFVDLIDYIYKAEVIQQLQNFSCFCNVWAC